MKASDSDNSFRPKSFLNPKISLPGIYALLLVIGIYTLPVTNAAQPSLVSAAALQVRESSAANLAPLAKATRNLPTTSAGQLEFSSGSYSTPEGAGAVITVTRTGGSDGALVAQIPITDVTTTAGADYLRVGNLDTTFTTTASTSVSEIAVQTRTDNKILIGGSFTTINGTPQAYMARLNPDGTLDSGFAPVLNDRVFGISIQADGKIVIGGLFTTVNSITRTRLARLNTDGSLDMSFTATANNEVYAMAVQTDGKIIVGGQFTETNSISRSNIARLNSDGSFDPTFTPTTNSAVYAIRLQTDNKIVIGGPFTTTNSTARSRLARLNADGSLDVNFNPTINNAVYTLGIQFDEKIIIGGVFATVNGVGRPNIARLNPDGTLDSSFSHITNASVLGVDIQNDGKIIIGGSFTTVNGISHPRIARIIENYTVSWAAGESGPKTVTIPIIQDGVTEVAETAKLELQVISGTATIGAIPTATLIIESQFYSTTTSLTSNPNPSLVDESVTFTATVAPPTASGVVTFTFNGLTSTTSPLVNGLATYMTTTLPVGTYTVTATYGGENDSGAADYLGSSTQPYTQQVIPPCNPQVVTSNQDDGKASLCGTFSFALNTTASGAISFALVSGNTITFTGSLTATLQSGVALDGGATGIVLNGNGVAGDGLRLGGNNTLTNLTIRRFSGRELVGSTSTGTGASHLYRVKIES